MVFRAESKECVFCPNYASKFGAMHEFAGRKEEPRIFPYVWAATSSSQKLKQLQDVFKMIGYTGRVLPFPKEILPEAPQEEDHLVGAEIARAKLWAYWQAFARYERLQFCHRYRICFPEHLFLANDVNVSDGIAGGKMEESLRKPSGAGVGSESELVDFIVGRYKKFKMADWIVHRIEAAVAMLLPLSQQWDQPGAVRVVSGVSRVNVQLPLKLLTNEEFVREYVKYAIEKSGSLRHLLNTAGGIMAEYLADMCVLWGGEVVVSMPKSTDCAGGNEAALFLSHARGFPPQLVMALLDIMNSGSNPSNYLVFEPTGKDKDVVINGRIIID